MLLNVVEANAAVPRHYHGYEEVIAVQEGQIWVSLDDEKFYASPGQTAIIPPNKIHAWGNEGPAIARVHFVWPVLEPFAPGKSTYVEGLPPKVS